MDKFLILLQIATGIITAIGTVAITTWKVSRFLSNYESKIASLINDHKADDAREFNKIRAEMDQQGDILRHEVGETASSLRTHMHNIELTLGVTKSENLDTFLKRSSFYAVVTELTSDIKELTKQVSSLQGLVLAKRMITLENNSEKS